MLRRSCPLGTTAFAVCGAISGTPALDGRALLIDPTASQSDGEHRRRRPVKHFHKCRGDIPVMLPGTCVEKRGRIVGRNVALSIGDYDRSSPHNIHSFRLTFSLLGLRQPMGAWSRRKEKAHTSRRFLKSESRPLPGSDRALAVLECAALETGGHASSALLCEVATWSFLWNS